MTEEEILQAVKTVLDTPSYKENAGTISDSFKASGGPNEARLFQESLVSHS
jgi:UDP:flavonoid glycosyltransferase YjiC (YdhE family)